MKCKDSAQATGFPESRGAFATFLFSLTLLSCLKTSTLNAVKLSSPRSMSSSAIVRAALFAAGALVGGGVATVLSSRQQSTPIAASPSESASPSKRPIVEVNEIGKMQIIDGAMMPSSLSPILRYGNPGQST